MADEHDTPPGGISGHDDCMCVRVRSETGEYSEEVLSTVNALDGLDEVEVVDGWLVVHCIQDIDKLKAAAGTLAVLFPGQPVHWTSPGPI